MNQKKLQRMILPGVFLLIILVICACGAQGETTPTKTQTHAVSTTEKSNELTAADVVNYYEQKKPTLVDDFCTQYAIIGNDDVSRKSFVTGFEQTAPDTGPTGDEVYEELRSRC